MAWEYSTPFLKVILVLENLSEVNFWTSKQIFQFSKSIFWTSMPSNCCPTTYYGTSMPISGGPTAYHWTSMPPRTWDPGNTASQANLRTSHPSCHSIKLVNWTAILAVVQSNQ